VSRQSRAGLRNQVHDARPCSTAESGFAPTYDYPRSPGKDAARPPVNRRVGHLGYQVSPNGHIYLVVRPDVLMSDLRFAADLAAIFSQSLMPAYLERPRTTRKQRVPSGNRPAHYRFDSHALVTSLERGGHEDLGWREAA
jgi:hypothetical protein